MCYYWIISILTESNLLSPKISTLFILQWSFFDLLSLESGLHRCHFVSCKFTKMSCGVHYIWFDVVPQLYWSRNRLNLRRNRELLQSVGSESKKWVIVAVVVQTWVIKDTTAGLYYNHYNLCKHQLVPSFNNIWHEWAWQCDENIKKWNPSLFLFCSIPSYYFVLSFWSTIHVLYPDDSWKLNTFRFVLVDFQVRTLCISFT